MKKVVILALLVSLFSSVNTVGAADDDFLLSIIPSIIAGANAECGASHKGKCESAETCEAAGGHWVSNQCETPSESSSKIRQLAGDWKFSWPHFANFTENRYLRFDHSKIMRIDAVTTAIEGSIHTSNFSEAYPGIEVIGAYDSNVDLYIVMALPTSTESNSGNVFTFVSTERNASVDCRYLSSSDGDIYPAHILRDYHCKRLTKARLN